MKARRSLVILVVLVSMAFGLVGCGGRGNVSAEPKLVDSWRGSGYENTTPLIIKSKPWSIAWAYNPGTYDLEFFAVTVYDAVNGNIVDVATSTPGKYSGSHYVYATGTFYLAITGSDWAVKVWEYR